VLVTYLIRYVDKKWFMSILYVDEKWFTST
jgi:hypothetical protein